MGYLVQDCGCGCGYSKLQKELVCLAVLGLLFFAVAHPATFAFMADNVWGGITDAGGYPSTAGVALHAVVFCAVTFFVVHWLVGACCGPAMMKKKSGGCGGFP